MARVKRGVVAGGTLVAGLVCCALFASTAVATTYNDTCATSGERTQFQDDLNSAGASAGSTVILDGLCIGSYALPDNSAFTLEGAPGTTSGFDGDALSVAQLTGGVESMTLEHLSFENAADGALRLYNTAGTLTLADDTFADDASTDNYPPVAVFASSGGPCTGPEGSLVIEGSTFLDNTNTPNTSMYEDGYGDGGALGVGVDCSYDPITLSDNTFIGNTLAASSYDGVGGALEVAMSSGSSVPDPTVVQTDNVFDSNQVTATGSPPSHNYGGGGEWAEGVNLESTGDRFSRNTLPGTSGSSWAWGAGLGIVNSDCTTGSPETESTLTDDVVAANTIADGAGSNPADALGAGIYLGCGYTPGADTNHLDLFDSTVTENSVSPAGAGAIAGIEGHSSDQLLLDNSILFGDQGGGELGGFGGSGGAFTPSYSDICSGSSPYPGTGDVCADPMLADDGNPSSFDVHETAASPTIDAGSNSLIPTGLGTDVFGAPRTLAFGACPVDIGAAEYASLCAVPGAPTAVSAALEVETGVVSFTPPVADGSAVTSYTVTASPGGVHASAAGGPLTLTGLAPNTTYTFSVTATNAVGTGPASVASASFKTLPLPSISKLKLSSGKFAAAKSGGPTSSSKGTGTSVSYVDNEAATSTLAFYHAEGGHKQGSACVASARAAKAKSCTRYVSVGSITHLDSVHNTNKIHFSGRLNGHALKGGTYQLRITPTLDGVDGHTVDKTFNVR
jgi:hypothetical protein